MAEVTIHHITGPDYVVQKLCFCKAYHLHFCLHPLHTYCGSGVLQDSSTTDGIDAGLQPRTLSSSLKNVHILRPLPVPLLWSLTALYSPFSFLSFALHCCQSRLYCFSFIFFFWRLQQILTSFLMLHPALAKFYHLPRCV